MAGYCEPLMAEWLEQASQWHEMYFDDLEVMSSNPGRTELGVHSTSVLSRPLTKNIVNDTEKQYLVCRDSQMKILQFTHRF